MLLKYGANPNTKDALGNNPLHLAACTHNIEVVTLLLKGGNQLMGFDQNIFQSLNIFIFRYRCK